MEDIEYGICVETEENAERATRNAEITRRYVPLIPWVMQDEGEA